VRFYRKERREMQDYRLRVGMRFTRQGREYEILESLRGRKLKVRDIECGACFAQGVEELVGDLFAGKIELLGEDATRPVLLERLEKNKVTDLTMLDDGDPLKRELLRRMQYVEEALGANRGARSHEALSHVIQRVKERLGDTRPPSVATLRRWIRIYLRAGQDVRALAPLFKKRGSGQGRFVGKRLGKFTEEDYERAKIVAAIVERAIRTKYLTRQRLPISEAHDEAERAVKKENQFRGESDKLPVPAYSSIYRAVKRLDPYEVCRAREGKRVADEKFRTNKQGPRPTRVLERVECDHTRLDVMVVDPQTRLPLGRPWLTTIIDVYSKMILGFYLSFHPPGAVSVLQCLLHAIRPKAYLKNDYPRVEHEWPTYGIPEWLVVDNAREFHGDDLQDACLQIGTGVQYSPVQHPNYRPSIERWFGTLNKRLHGLPGTTFSNIFEKGDYDPQKHAVVTLQALLEVVHIWIVDVYHQRIHRGIQDIPSRRWKESVAEWPPNLPCSSTDLNILVGFVERRCVGPSGVELFGLHYNCRELGLIRRSLARGEKAKVKYDPNDISRIYVWDKVGNSFLMVPALNQEYTAGLTLWQHEAIKKYTRQFLQSLVDAEALCRAKENIQEIVSRERLLTGKALRRARRASVRVKPAASLPADDSSTEEPRLADMMKNGSGTIRFLPARSESADIAGNDTGVGSMENIGEIETADPNEGWGASYDLPRREDTSRGE
jgi:putative transposase